MANSAPAAASSDGSLPGEDDSASKQRYPLGERARRLLRLVVPYRGRLAFALLCLVISSSLSLVFPKVVEQVIDAALGSGDPTMLNWAVGGLVVVFLVQAIFSFGRSYLFTWIGERVVADLRHRVYRHLLTLEIGFFDERRVGELTSRLSSDATVVQNTVAANISMALRFGVQFIGGLVILVWSAPDLSLVILATVPFLALQAGIFGRRVRTLSTRVQDRLADATNVVEETLGGIRTVKAFGAEAIEQERYGGRVEDSFGAAMRRSVNASGFFAGASFTVFIGIAGILLLGGHKVMSGSMTVGELTSFVLYAFIIAIALGSVSTLWTDFQRAVGASERIFEILDRTPAIQSIPSPRNIPNGRGSLRFEQVWFRYPSRPDIEVLRGVDVEVEGGTVVALVGRSGAGKSTILHLVLRLYEATEGRVLLDGVDITEVDPAELRRRIALVAQDPVIFSASIRENILYGRPDASEHEVMDAARAARVDEFASQLPEGYDTELGERGVRLSGGQRQRIAIARALLRNPRILLLDEATSSLDSYNESLVQQALDALMRGRTTLVVAHRLSTIAHADKVVVMDRGEVVQQGRHDALLASAGPYRTLYESQYAPAQEDHPDAPTNQTSI